MRKLVFVSLTFLALAVGAVWLSCGNENTIASNNDSSPEITVPVGTTGPAEVSFNEDCVPPRVIFECACSNLSVNGGKTDITIRGYTCPPAKGVLVVGSIDNLPVGGGGGDWSTGQGLTTDSNGRFCIGMYDNQGAVALEGATIRVAVNNYQAEEVPASALNDDCNCCRGSTGTTKVTPTGE